jgi:hypothetical protein
MRIGVTKVRLGAMVAAVALTAAVGFQAQAAGPFKIKSAVMATKFENTKTSGVTNTFKPTDHMIYCVVKTDRILQNIKARFVWTAVNVKGEKANTKFLDKSGLLKKADIIWGSASLKNNWPTGSYKVDVYVDGSKIKSMNYSVR